MENWPLNGTVGVVRNLSGSYFMAKINPSNRQTRKCDYGKAQGFHNHDISGRVALHLKKLAAIR
jgi:hypothetical protein